MHDVLEGGSQRVRERNRENGREREWEWLIYMRHDLFICDMTDLYVTGLMYLRLESRRQRDNGRERARENENDSFICDMTDLNAIWLIYTLQDPCICDRIYVYVTQEWETTRELERESEREWKWLNYMRHDWFTCDMTYLYVTGFMYMWQDPCLWGSRVGHNVRMGERERERMEATHLYATWLNYMWYVAYEWVTSHMNESRHMSTSHVTYEWVTSHIHESRHM